MSFFSKIFSELFKSSESESEIKNISRPTQTVSKGYGKRGRITKYEQVRNHLIEHETITSWEAIQKYGATRLSDIIFRLRNSGLLIESIVSSKLDRNGNNTNFVTYKLHN